MKSRIIYEPGDAVTFKRFEFINKAGGTGMSDWEFDEPFKGEAKAQVVKAFHDYETGQRYIGKALSPDLKSYLERNGRGLTVYFGEFDL